MNKMYIGDFEWVNGSVNDNIRALLKQLGKSYYNSFNGDIYTGNGQKVTAVYKDNNKFDVYVEVQ